MRLSKARRLRRISKARIRMKRQGVVRLVVHRTPRHIYAQIIDGEKVVAVASTLDQKLRKGPTGNKVAASKVGALIAQRSKDVGVEKVAFDRSGFKYHGRVQALAEAAREGGLSF